ncbi:MAG: DinB family protein [Gemmatimonadaceae bacterium]
MTEDTNAAVTELDRFGHKQQALLDKIESGTTPEGRERKPAPDEWSLTEVVQHLALVSEAMLRSGRQRDESSPSLEHDGFARLQSRLRSGSKSKAPSERIVPRPGVTWGQAVANARGGLERWRESLTSGRMDNMSYPHPRAGELSSEQTVQFLSEHLDHHVAQVDRLLGN